MLSSYKFNIKVIKASSEKQAFPCRYLKNDYNQPAN